MAEEYQFYQDALAEAAAELAAFDRAQGHTAANVRVQTSRVRGGHQRAASLHRGEAEASADEQKQEAQNRRRRRAGTTLVTIHVETDRRTIRRLNDYANSLAVTLKRHPSTGEAIRRLLDDYDDLAARVAELEVTQVIRSAARTPPARDG